MSKDLEMLDSNFVMCVCINIYPYPAIAKDMEKVMEIRWSKGVGSFC